MSDRATVTAAAKMGRLCTTCRDAAKVMTTMEGAALILQNVASAAAFHRLADGLYEAEEWIAERMADETMQVNPTEVG